MKGTPRVVSYINGLLLCCIIKVSPSTDRN